MLDLQTVRPPPRVESAGRVVCDLDATDFFARADANDRVLLDAVAEGELELVAEEHLEVLQRWPSGSELMRDLDEARMRKIPWSMRGTVGAIAGECAVRESCRTRRLRRR